MAWFAVPAVSQAAAQALPYVAPVAKQGISALTIIIGLMIGLFFLTIIIAIIVGAKKKTGRKSK